MAGAATMEKLTSYGDVTGYDNFYEFGTGKNDPTAQAHTLKTRLCAVLRTLVAGIDLGSFAKAADRVGRCCASRGAAWH